MSKDWWEAFELPQLVAHGDAVAHNVATMAAWCAERDVLLAPHAKTTMSAPIIAAQLAAGAWGATVATSRQAKALLAMGVRRVIVANLLVEPHTVAELARLFAAQDAELITYVDSLESVALLEAGLAQVSQPWSVLVEIGIAGGRTGVRNAQQAVAVAEAVRDAPHLSLVGTAEFEGVLSDPAAVDAFLQTQHLITTRLQAAGLFAEVPGGPIVSAGGSAFFDRVVAILGPRAFDFPVRTVLRSGCYVTHDHGLYARTSPMPERFEPALELLASVWSRPEPGVIIVGFGRRDVPFDSGLPTVLDHHDWTVERLWDQHAFVTVPADATVAPGDVLHLGISHPCGAFDRWRQIPVLDHDHRQVDTYHPAL